MGYYLRRPNGSKYDLSGDQYDWYIRCEQLVAALGRQRIIMQPDIVQLITDYGKKDGGKCVYDAINYSRGLGHWSVDAIEKMLKGEIKPERSAPSHMPRTEPPPAPRSQRTGPRSVQYLLGVKPPKYPTPDHYYDPSAAEPGILA